jgi:outer membrane immunogenic protein
MRLRLLGTVAAAAGFIVITASVQAADIAKPAKPVAPVVVKAPVLLFQGHYVGLVGGYAWGTTSAEALNPGGAPPLNFNAPDVHPKGWLGGFTIGSNWQGPNHVFGVEADYVWANIRGSGQWTEDDSASEPGPNTNDPRTQALATLRVRWGHPFGSVMPYVTGGLAWQNTHLVWTYEKQSTQTFHLNPWGWTVGVGIEVAHSPKVSWKIEYLYAGFGSKNEPTAIVSDDLGHTPGVKFANNIQMIRFGVNFRFP